MNKTGQGAVVGIMISSIIGIIILGVVFGITTTQTSTYTVENESVALVSGVGTLENDDIISITYFGNMSEDMTHLIGNGLNESDGVLDTNMTNANYDRNYNISYGYYPEGYITSSMGRMVVQNVALILAVLIFVVVAGAIAAKKNE